MASIYDIKPAFQQFLRPLSNFLAQIGVTPNQITLAAVLLSFLSGAAIFNYPFAEWPLLLVPVVLFLRMALNAIDGMIAREHHMKSALGTFLNELGDVVSDIFIYLPFSLIPWVSETLVVCFVILSIISEMAGVVAIQIGATRRYDGPMGKSDRAFVFGAIALYLGCDFPADPWINYLLVMVNILIVVTIFNRISKALQEVKT